MKTRKEKEEHNRREHIIDTAEVLFAQKGLGHTSVADIAQAAEFGVGTLYKYFSDKNTLITSWAATRMDEHFSALEEALKVEATPPEMIDRFIEAYLISIQKRTHFFKVYYSHLHLQADDEPLKIGLQQLETRKMELFRRIDDIYQRGIDEGYFFNVGDAGYLTAATWGILMAFYFMAQQRFNGTVNVNEMRKMVRQLLFEQVRLSA
ncbi:MAG: TetR/AcrR family transcriptional regulator [Deltaproteobacteria bacterium]|nr:TetR/AcrR family transcriptional regulator [Deltaproteobacteria bacterium]MBN2670923.1 TetR/AcrR family transcriptional regulator [Deltaproteobacteria bacterium]